MSMSGKTRKFHLLIVSCEDGCLLYSIMLDQKSSVGILQRVLQGNISAALKLINCFEVFSPGRANKV